MEGMQGAKQIKPVEGMNYEQLFGTSVPHDAVVPAGEGGFDQFFGGSVTMLDASGNDPAAPPANRKQEARSEGGFDESFGGSVMLDASGNDVAAAPANTGNASGRGWGSGGTFVDFARGESVPFAKTLVVDEERAADAHKQTGALPPGVKVKTIQGVGMIVKTTLRQKFC
jgi:hypothetical protein